LSASPFAERLAGLLTTRRYGRTLAWFDETDTTMAEARRLAEAGAEDGTLVVAGRQTAGRGRQGRTFVSPEGGLYMTLVLAPPGAPADGWRCGFAAALAARDALRAAGGDEVEFDWPNDLVAGERKIAGILMELLSPSPDGPAAPTLLLGVGLNVGGDPSAVAPALAGPAGPAPGFAGRDARAEVAAHFLRRMEELAPRCADDASWRGVLDEVRAVSRAARGARIVVRLADGTEIAGRGIGIDEDGAVRLRDDDGAEHRVRYAERVYAARRDGGEATRDGASRAGER